MKDLKGIAAVRRARWSSMALAGLVAGCAVNQGADGGLVAGWNLNEVRAGVEDLSADFGKGNLSLAGLDGNWTLYSGTMANAIDGWLPGEALGLRGSALNGSELRFNLDSALAHDAVFSFATMRSSTGFSQLRLDVFDGSGWNAYWTGVVGEAWDVASIALEPSRFDRFDPRFRLVIDGAVSPQGTIRFDNFRVDTFVVPGPASVALLLAAPLVVGGRRRGVNSLAGR